MSFAIRHPRQTPGSQDSVSSSCRFFARARTVASLIAKSLAHPEPITLATIRCTQLLKRTPMGIIRKRGRMLPVIPAGKDTCYPTTQTENSWPFSTSPSPVC